MGWEYGESAFDVQIDGSPSVKKRNVYGIRKLAKHKIQVGYVRVERRDVVVWRAFDPSEVETHSKWKKGLWRNAYRLEMPRDQATNDPKRPTYALTEVVSEDVSVELPRVEVTITPRLRLYLQGGLKD